MASKRDESYEAERRRRRDEEPLDYNSETNTSVPDKSVPTEIDGRSTARTDFIPNRGHFDSPLGEGETVERYGEEIEYSEWLHQLHQGNYLDGQSGAEKGRALIEKDIHTIASIFDLTDSQRSRAIHIVNCVEDLTEVDKGETAALAAISIAVNEDGRWIQNGDKSITDVLGNESDEDNGKEGDIPTWESVLDDYNTTPRAVHKARERLREEI